MWLSAALARVVVKGLVLLRGILTAKAMLVVNRWLATALLRLGMKCLTASIRGQVIAVPRTANGAQMVTLVVFRFRVVARSQVWTRLSVLSPTLLKQWAMMTVAPARFRPPRILRTGCFVALVGLLLLSDCRKWLLGLIRQVE